MSCLRGKWRSLTLIQHEQWPMVDVTVSARHLCADMTVTLASAYIVFAFLSGRCGAHSIHTALQFLFRPGLMMHAGIYPLLPKYFWVGAAALTLFTQLYSSCFDRGGWCMLGYIPFFLGIFLASSRRALTVQTDVRAHMRMCHTLQFVYYTLSCLLIDTFATGLSPGMFSNLIEIFQIVHYYFF